MEDCCSEGQEFELILSPFLSVGMKFSNQHHAVCCSRALLATRVSLCSFVCLGLENDYPILLYIKRVSSKVGHFLHV